jgi:hypothetical protein
LPPVISTTTAITAPARCRARSGVVTGNRFGAGRV